MIFPLLELLNCWGNGKMGIAGQNKNQVRCVQPKQEGCGAN